jgi:hypothetical protein
MVVSISSAKVAVSALRSSGCNQMWLIINAPAEVVGSAGKKFCFEKNALAAGE